MTTYSDSAIEAAARAVFDEINEWYPLEGVPNLTDHAKTLATAALTAAAPHIQAAALRDAAESFQGVMIGFGGRDPRTSGSAWLRARADQLEKGQS